MGKGSGGTRTSTKSNPTGLNAAPRASASGNPRGLTFVTGAELRELQTNVMPVVRNAEKIINNREHEIELSEDRIYLSVATVTPTMDKKLQAQGWVFLNNGVSLPSGKIGDYYSHKRK